MVAMVTDKKSREEAIRRDYFEKGLTYRKIMKKYRISPRDIARIVKGEKTVKPAESAEFLSAELKILIDREEVEMLEKCPVGTSVELISEDFDALLKMGRMDDGLIPEIEKDMKDVLFSVVGKLRKRGYRINRSDLSKFLAGEIDFAVVRWTKVAE